MFAAFPHWYATLFSSFYVALFLLLAALIVRGVAFEFAVRTTHPAGGRFGIGAFSLAVPFQPYFWGVAFANLVKGVPIDANMQYVGTFGT